MKISCGDITYVDQFREVDDTLAEYPSERLQKSLEDITDWEIYRRAPQVYESTSTASSNYNDTQQSEILDQLSVPITHP